MNALQRYLPSHSLRIETALDAAECEAALLAATDTSDALFPRRRPGLYFRGRVSHGQFSLTRILRGRNSFQPVIRGRIIPMSGGSAVEIQLRVHDALGAFMLMWFGGVTLAGIATIAGLMSGQTEPHPMMLMPVLLLLFGAFMPRIGFRAELSPTRAALLEVLEGELVQDTRDRLT